LTWQILGRVNVESTWPVTRNALSSVMFDAALTTFNITTITKTRVGVEARGRCVRADCRKEVIDDPAVGAQQGGKLIIRAIVRAAGAELKQKASCAPIAKLGVGRGVGIDLRDKVMVRNHPQKDKSVLDRIHDLVGDERDDLVLLNKCIKHAESLDAHDVSDRAGFEIDARDILGVNALDEEPEHVRGHIGHDNNPSKGARAKLLRNGLAGIKKAFPIDRNLLPFFADRDLDGFGTHGAIEIIRTRK
jgi:hypothetical protein